MTTEEKELFDVNQQLLDAIAQAKWEVYKALVDPCLTSFEPESIGSFVRGLDFHHFGFNQGPWGPNPGTDYQTVLTSPLVRVIGDVGVVTYLRVDQLKLPTGLTVRSFEETRIWQRNQEGDWILIHFHRSIPSRPPEAK